MICFKSMHISLQPLITFETGKFVCSDLVDRSTHISFGVDNLTFQHDQTWTSIVLCCFLEGYGSQGGDHKFQCVPSDLSAPPLCCGLPTVGSLGQRIPLLGHPVIPLTSFKHVPFYVDRLNFTTCFLSKI